MDITIDGSYSQFSATIVCGEVSIKLDLGYMSDPARKSLANQLIASAKELWSEDDE